MARPCHLWDDMLRTCLMSPERMFITAAFSLHPPLPHASFHFMKFPFSFLDMLSDTGWCTGFP